MSRAIILLSAEEMRRKRALILWRRKLRDASNPLELPENEFVSNFRLNKAAFRALCDELGAVMPIKSGPNAVPLELKILAVLSFYANGSYQRIIGVSHLHNVSQSTFSICLEEVTNGLNHPSVLLRHIRFPATSVERANISIEYMRKFGLPGVIGCIDGTHIAIIRPVENEGAYFNRKYFHSLNVMVICDANMQILHVNSRFGGPSHDSYVWNRSPIKSYLEDLHERGEKCWLLGDSGYPQREYLMTPILGAQDGTPEAHYTKVHCSARNVVECCFGVLKARWRCLLGHRVLHYSPVKAGKIVNACVVLHNIANTYRLPIPGLSSSDEFFMHTDLGNNYSTDPPAFIDYRAALVRRLWETRR